MFHRRTAHSKLEMSIISSFRMASHSRKIFRNHPKRLWGKICKFILEFRSIISIVIRKNWNLIKNNLCSSLSYGEIEKRIVWELQSVLSFALGAIVLWFLIGVLVHFYMVFLIEKSLSEKVY